MCVPSFCPCWAVVTCSPLSCCGPTGLVTCGDAVALANAAGCRSARSGGRLTSVRGRHPTLRFLPRRVTLGAQEGDRGLEVLEVVEGLVDGGEAQVSNLVELAQRLEDGHAHLV